VRRLIARHPVATRPITARPAPIDLWGDGTPAHLGMTLDQFVASIRVQADWFVEPTLTDADRDDAWAILRRTSRGSNVLAGTGDLRMADLRTASAADWTALEAFGRGCDAASDTVRILNRAAYTLPQRVALGDTLLGLEAIVPCAVLRLTVSELQLSEVSTGAGLLAAIAAYWAQFAPHLQRRYSPAPGARGLEFQAIMDLVRAPGIAAFAALHGRIRNLHRFSVAMLTRLRANWADTSRARPVHLVLHTSHDESSFQESAGLFEDLVLNSPNLVLFLEGQDHLADITALIPVVAATYGQPDATGTPRIAEAMIAGHGQARSVQLAGTGVPGVRDENVEYPSESLDLDTNLANTQALLDALVTNLDPATARVVFAGCLVGANPVPLGTPTAGMAGHIAGTPSLATFTQQRATAAGLGANIVQGARASVALGAASSLHDAAGNLAIQYAFDPDAFGTAIAYVATGHEPEGETAGRIRLALAWLDQVPGNPDVRAFLDAQVVAGAGGAPELSPAARAELGEFQESTVLERLGRLLPSTPPVGGGAALPNANAELVHTGDNRVLIEPRPYVATVLAAGLNVRDRPHMGGSVIDVVHAGDVLNVAGFTHNWAGIDLDGTLGFVHKNFITAP
jgi:Bacterial SH3 domain